MNAAWFRSPIGIAVAIIFGSLFGDRYGLIKTGGSDNLDGGAGDGIEDEQPGDDLAAGARSRLRASE